jgi:hypothetical protein
MTTAPAERLTLLIPCEMFFVKAVMAPSASLTALERLALRAINAGATTIDTLNELFAIGHRPMLRLVLDFLDRALITCNFETGEIQVTPAVVELITKNRLDEIEAGGRTEEQFELMRDLVAGTILRRRRQPPMKPQSRVTAVLPPNSTAVLAPEDIALTVRTLVRKRLFRGSRPRHVVEMAIDCNGGQGRDLEVEVRPVLNESDWLTIHVEGPDDLPSRTRSSLEKTLTALANEEHAQNAFKVLRGKSVKREETSPPGLHALIRELQTQFEVLKAADPGTYESRQAKLLDLAVTLDDMIRRAANVTVEIITSPGDHAKAAVEIIDGAKRQVVIACPSARRDATMQLRDAIGRAAANRGVRIFFLLKRRDEDTGDVDPSIFLWLDTLRRSHPGRIFFHDDLAARCNGRFIVADGGDALVSSAEFLYHPVRDNRITAAIRLTARPSAPGSEEQRLVATAALDLLTIAKGLYPNADDAEQLVDSWFRFGSFGASELTDLPLPTMPRPREDDPYKHQRLLLWLREWERRIVQTEAAATRLGATHEVVRNDEHHEWLQNAVRTAQQRLLIVSRVISDSAVRVQFVDDLRTCLKRPGMRVAIFYGKIEPSAVRALHLLRDEFGGRMQLVQRDMVREAVRLLVCDDWCLIGGFDFLGPAVSRTGADKYRVPAEVGLRLDGAVIVEELVAELSAAMPPLAKWTGMEPVNVPAPAAPLPSLRRSIDALFNLIQEDLTGGECIDDEETRTRRIGQVVRTWFEDAATAEEAYAELTELDAIGAPFVEQAIATCLDIYRLASDHPATQRWFRRIIEERWRCADFAGSLFILGAAPPFNVPSVPPRRLAMLAARVDAGSATEELFYEVATLESDFASALGVAALGLPLVLLDRINPAQTMVDIRGALPPPLRNWTDAIVDFRVYHPSGLDLSDVAAMSKSRGGHDRRRHAQALLTVELERCIGLRLEFAIGAHVWAHLVKMPLGFEELLHATKNNDTTPIREFVRQYEMRDAEEILDEATDYVVRRRRMRDNWIEGDHRRLLVTRIRNVLREAQIWAADSATAKPSAAQDQIVALARTLARDLPAVDDLALHLEKNAFPAVLIAGLRSRLDPVLELGI